MEANIGILGLAVNFDGFQLILKLAILLLEALQLALKLRNLLLAALQLALKLKNLLLKDLNLVLSTWGFYPLCC